jgi:hypothetical protein
MYDICIISHMIWYMISKASHMVLYDVHDFTYDITYWSNVHVNMWYHRWYHIWYHVWLLLSLWYCLTCFLRHDVIYYIRLKHVKMKHITYDIRTQESGKKISSMIAWLISLEKACGIIMKWCSWLIMWYHGWCDMFCLLLASAGCTVVGAMILQNSLLLQAQWKLPPWPSHS